MEKYDIKADRSALIALTEKIESYAAQCAKAKVEIKDDKTALDALIAKRFDMEKMSNSLSYFQFKAKKQADDDLADMDMRITQLQSGIEKRKEKFEALHEQLREAQRECDQLAREVANYEKTESIKNRIKENAYNGDVQSQNELADMYRLEGNVEQAIAYYEMAIAQGSVQAIYNMGILYRDSLKDLRTAYYYFLEAGNRMHPEAQYALGLLYYKGEAVEKDYAMACEIYREAARNGSAGAQYGVALCTLRGHGTAKDVPQAIEELRKLAGLWQNHQRSGLPSETAIQGAEKWILPVENNLFWGELNEGLLGDHPDKKVCAAVIESVGPIMKEVVDKGMVFAKYMKQFPDEYRLCALVMRHDACIDQLRSILNKAFAFYNAS